MIATAGKQATTARNEDTVKGQIHLLEMALTYLEARKNHWHRLPKHDAPFLPMVDTYTNNNPLEAREFAGLAPTQVPIAVA